MISSEILIDIIKNEKDNPDVKEFHNICHKICFEIGHQGEPMLAYLFNDRTGDFYVRATSNTKDIVGVMAISINDYISRVYKTPPGEAVHIEATIVRPDMQRRGISTAMFNYLEKHLKGFEFVTSEVAKCNYASLEARQKMGFEVLKENIYGSMEEDVSLIMEKPVDKARATKTWTEAKPEVAAIRRGNAEVTLPDK